MKTIVGLLALGALAGCYTAEFAEDVDGVFACVSTDDCASGLSCVRGVCVSDAGPVVEIAGPEENTVFDVSASVVFPINIAGSDLALAEPNGTHEAGRGYLRVLVDGEALPSPIIDGSLDGSVSELVDLGILEGGFHRIRVQAFGLDNERYENPSATAEVGFWVDDGLPHIGVRSPWPGDTYTVGEPMDVEVVCHNCTFIDPELAASDRVDEPFPEGHSHVFFDRREGVSGMLDYPACLPACNFDYATNGSIKPSGEAGQNRVQGVVLQVPTKPGALQVTASLNYTGHFPFPSDSLDPAVWTADPELMQQLVFDSISVELQE